MSSFTDLSDSILNIESSEFSCTASGGARDIIGLDHRSTLSPNV